MSEPKCNDIKGSLLSEDEKLSRLLMSPSINGGRLSKKNENEIDLREIWDVLWKGRWWITGTTLLFSAIALIYSINLPNRYKSEVVLAPAQEQSGGLGGLTAQYGNLAAMAGITLPGGQNSNVDQALALVKSWPFLTDFIERYNLKPKIMAVKGWDKESNKIIYDTNIYDPDSFQWVREPKPDRPSEPSSYETYDVFSKMISVSHDSKSGLIKLSVEYYVPQLAYEWTMLLIQELNRHFQMRDIREATKNIEYLREKINETSITEMQAVFYRMIESQMKTLMLAEVSDEYLAKSVVRPMLPERKSRPSRLIILFVSSILGFGGSIFFVLLISVIKNKEV